MFHYECWEHTYGQQYLIRLDDANLVTGVCGPFRVANSTEANRVNFDYDVQPQHTAWVRSHMTEFHRIEPITASM